MKKKGLLFMLLLLSAFIAQAQTLHSSESDRHQSMDPPNSNWGKSGMIQSSDRHYAAVSTIGGGNWINGPLPLPPNNHEFWISLRFDGTGGVRPTAHTRITGLTEGLEYEVIFYSMTATSEYKITGVYSRYMMNRFAYIIGGGDEIESEKLTPNQWADNIVRFKAKADYTYLYLMPGKNQPVTSGVNLSVSDGAINQVPFTHDFNSRTTPGSTPLVMNVLANATDVGGSIMKNTLDLDPSTDIRDTRIENNNGIWEADNIGNVTFTPKPGVKGNVSIEYTVKDNFTLDGKSYPATSSPKKITVLVESPELRVDKKITNLSKEYSSITDVIEYEIKVTNTGSMKITNIMLTDNNAVIPSGQGAIGTLLAGTASKTILATHQVTQADLDHGEVVNQAEVIGIDADRLKYTKLSDNPNTPTRDDATIAIMKQMPSLTVTKIVTSTGPYSAIGDLITYEITVLNSGNVTLNSLVLTDSNGVIAPGDEVIGILSPGQSKKIRVTHELTQADITAGAVSNQATVTGKDPKDNDITQESNDPDTQDVDDPTVITVEQTPDLSVTHTVTSTGPYNRVGDVIDYKIDIGNTGNVPLYNVELTEGNVLFPGGAFQIRLNETIHVTKNHTITQDDLDQGFINLLATVTAEARPSGKTVTKTAPTTRVNLTQEPAINLIKTAVVAGTGSGLVGEQVDYLFVVTNTGNTTLKDVRLTDDHFEGTPALVISTGAMSPSSDETSLLPNGTIEYRAQYIIKQNDIDRSTLSNQASVTANTIFTGINVSDLSGTSSGDDDATTITLDPHSPSLRLEKTGKLEEDGNRITYNFRVINTGNVTITNIVISDKKPGMPASINLDKTTLAPGEIATGRAIYILTQDDKDLGSVHNRASVTGEDPKGGIVGPIESVDPQVPTNSNNNTVTKIPQYPSFTLSKTADKTEIVKAGEKITYTILFKNTGNVSLINVNIADVLFPGKDLILPKVAPDEIIEHELIYTMTQADMDSGRISNSASASSIDPTGKSLPTKVEELVLPVLQKPVLTLTKTAVSTNHKKVGDVIRYELVLTNTGNVTIKDINISDNNADLTSLFPSKINKLEVGERINLTATHTITRPDMDFGYVYNQAVADAKDPKGQAVHTKSKDSRPASVDLPIDPNCPDCTITKLEIEDLFIPNAFTPNGDGRHDTFRIFGLDYYDQAELTIYNRSGNEVYRNRNYQNNWDGTGLNEGTYYYLIRLKKEGKTTEQKGWVLLKR